LKRKRRSKKSLIPIKAPPRNGKINLDTIQDLTGIEVFDSSELGANKKRYWKRRAKRSWSSVQFHKLRDDVDWVDMPMLSQWERTAREKPKGVEQLIAWRLPRQTVSDILTGPANIRLFYINEVKRWMDKDADATYWTWDHWCDMLEFYGDYMRRKWKPFLDLCEAKARKELPNIIRHHLGHELLPVLSDRREWSCRKCKSRSSSDKIKLECQK
jgi:hypothetical protein